MFTYGMATHGDTCTGPGAPGACTVLLSRTQTPAVASSWAHVPGGTYPWHRNGCCWIEPAGQKTYCIFGESGSEGPGSGLGIAYTTDISKGKFTQVNWTAGVPGDGGVGRWMAPLGADQQEIKLEAGTHMVQLDSGDLLHFYAAATPGWVADGNYTAGYIVLDKDDPTKIIQVRTPPPHKRRTHHTSACACRTSTRCLSHSVARDPPCNHPSPSPRSVGLASSWCRPTPSRPCATTTIPRTRAPASTPASAGTSSSSAPPPQSAPTGSGSSLAAATATSAPGSCRSAS